MVAAGLVGILTSEGLSEIDEVGGGGDDGESAGGDEEEKVEARKKAGRFGGVSLARQRKARKS